jgi:hypothetical protein
VLELAKDGHVDEAIEILQAQADIGNLDAARRLGEIRRGYRSRLWLFQQRSFTVKCSNRRAAAGRLAWRRRAMISSCWAASLDKYLNTDRFQIEQDGVHLPAHDRGRATP